MDVMVGIKKEFQLKIKNNYLFESFDNNDNDDHYINLIGEVDGEKNDYDVYYIY